MVSLTTDSRKKALDLSVLIELLQQKYSSLNTRYFENENSRTKVTGVYIADSRLKAAMGPFYPNNREHSELDFFVSVATYHRGDILRVSERFLFGSRDCKKPLAIEAATDFAKQIGFTIWHYDTKGRPFIVEEDTIYAYRGHPQYKMRKLVIPESLIYSHSLISRLHQRVDNLQQTTEAIIQHIIAYEKFGRSLAKVS